MRVMRLRNLFVVVTALAVSPVVVGRATADPAVGAATQPAAAAAVIDLTALRSPVLFRGDANTAYRDPAAVYHDGWFRLFFTVVKIEADGRPFHYTAWSKS